VHTKMVKAERPGITHTALHRCQLSYIQ